MWSIRWFPAIISYYLTSQLILVRDISQGLQITSNTRAHRSVSFLCASRSSGNGDAAHQVQIPIPSRRHVLTAASSATAFAFLLRNPETTHALENPPTKAELDRIKLGYEQIQYLLNNFEKETTVCRENGGECKRDADPIRRALGLRSTTDPLFQIEKVFAKVKYMDLDPDKLEQFFDATEEWNSSINMSNSMAFISQFGEYNPGGGKDEVLKYLNESKKQVIIAEKALKNILDCIGIE